MNPVAVILPVYRFPLSPEEEFSLLRARSVLGGHARFFVAPAGLRFPAGFLRGEAIVRFPARFFTYPHGYNRLLMTRRFFRVFGDYVHILIYQLDCVVFRDDLLLWCGRDYDYVGSPWYENYIYEYQRERKWWVGNGGFSLRKTASAIRVLQTRLCPRSHFPVPPPNRPRPGGIQWLFSNVQNRLKQTSGLWTVEDELANYGESEDRFWALDAARFVPGWKIPSAEEAMSFGFEQYPEECHRLIGGRLPFGCHAWTKHSRPFIEQLLDRAAALSPS